jgi:hypothetical protein
MADHHRTSATMSSRASSAAPVNEASIFVAHYAINGPARISTDVNRSAPTFRLLGCDHLSGADIDVNRVVSAKSSGEAGS